MYVLNTIYFKYAMIAGGFTAIFVILFMLWKKKYSAIEAGIHLVLTIGILLIANTVAKNSIPNLVRQEFINGAVTDVVWEEAYEYMELVTKSSGSGDKKKTWTELELVEVPDEYYIKTTVGSFDTNKEKFLDYAKKYNMVTEPATKWDRLREESGRTFRVNVPKNTISASDLHTYDNYISASKGIMSSVNPVLEERFRTSMPGYPLLVKDPEYGVYRMDSRLKDIDNTLKDETKVKLKAMIDAFQTQYASSKQCNIIYVVTKQTDYNYFLALRSLWLGGNKNDIIVVMNDKLSFVGVIAYTEVASFFTDIENLKYSDKYTKFKTSDEFVSALVEDSLDVIKKKYVRLPMATFESYKKTLSIPVNVDITLTIVVVLLQVSLFMVFYILGM